MSRTVKSSMEANRLVESLIAEKGILNIDGIDVSRMSGLEVAALREQIDKLSEADRQKVYENISRNYADTTEPLKAEDYPSWTMDETDAYE